VSVDIIDLVEANPGSRRRSLIFFTVAQQGDSANLTIDAALAAKTLANFDQLYSVITELLTDAIVAAQA
jgi:hypothetical protein